MNKTEQTVLALLVSAVAIFLLMPWIVPSRSERLDANSSVGGSDNATGTVDDAANFAVSQGIPMPIAPRCHGNYYILPDLSKESYDKLTFFHVMNDAVVITQGGVRYTLNVTKVEDGDISLELDTDKMSGVIEATDEELDGMKSALSNISLQCSKNGRVNVQMGNMGAATLKPTQFTNASDLINDFVAEDYVSEH